jgi:hypothetical protein
MPEEPRRTELKPTKVEVRRRIDITESLLIDCASVTEIRRYFADKESLHLGRRTVERYAEIAEQRIVKAAEPIRGAEIQKAKIIPYIGIFCYANLPSNGLPLGSGEQPF